MLGWSPDLRICPGSASLCCETLGTWPGLSGLFHSTLNEGIGLCDPQESFRLCCSKVLSTEKHTGVMEETGQYPCLLGTLS